MDRVNVTEADTALHDLLDRVESGEEILLTRNGRDVAKLVELTTHSPRHGNAVARAKALRDQIAVRGESFTCDELKGMRDEGRP